MVFWFICSVTFGDDCNDLLVQYLKKESCRCRHGIPHEKSRMMKTGKKATTTMREVRIKQTKQ